MNIFFFFSVYSQKTKAKLALSFGLFSISTILFLIYYEDFSQLNEYLHFYISAVVPAFFIGYFYMTYEKIGFVGINENSLVLRDGIGLMPLAFFEVSYEAIKDVYIAESSLNIVLVDGQSKIIRLDFLTCVNADGEEADWKHFLRSVKDRIANPKPSRFLIQRISESRVRDRFKKKTKRPHRKLIILLLIGLLYLAIRLSEKYNS